MSVYHPVNPGKVEIFQVEKPKKVSKHVFVSSIN